MNDSTKTILSRYEEVANIGGNQNVTLVQDISSKAFFVKKELTIFNAKVYESLRLNPISGTPTVYEAVEDDGVLYVIEQFLPGDTLDSIIESGKIFSEDETADIILKLLVIVSSLHNFNPPIIHRDIKPENILLDHSGEVFLLDMNAAKVYTPEKNSDTELIGTAGFASPEQYGFATSSAASDIYSIGILMNILLTGKTPNEGKASGRLAPIIEKCTNIDPVNRFDSCKGLSAAIKRAMGLESFKEKLSHFLPPGFRTKRPINMIVASMIYIILIATSISLETSNGRLIWLNRIVFFACGIVVIFFTCNYLGIQEKLGITNIKKQALRIIVILAIDILIPFLFIFLFIALPTWTL